MLKSRLHPFFVGSLWLIFKSGYLSLLFLVWSLSHYLLACSLCVFIHFLLLSHLCLSTHTCVLFLSYHCVEVILSPLLIRVALPVLFWQGAFSEFCAAFNFHPSYYVSSCVSHLLPVIIASVSACSLLCHPS